ncbi:MAG TPA: hypothetical protein VMV46_22100 [Thermoanaerobaculia bacterium]|nr:hypothetical protein [Thermoanaerobaculia bacterium]
MKRVVLGIFGVSAVATAGDAVWYELGIEHRLAAGVIHGAILLAAVGAVVGLAARRPAAGAAAGAASGVGGALVFYLLARPAGGGIAMGAGWATVWILLAALDGRVLRRPPRSWTAILARALGASALSGLAFFAVLGTLWGPPPEAGRNYLVQLGAWLLAWAPGLLALTWPGAAEPSEEPT